MTHFLVQAALQDTSGLSRDRYVNTFHVEASGLTTGNYDDLTTAFRAFYTEVGTVAHPTAYYIAPHAKVTPGHLKYYNQGDTIPRSPTRIDDLLVDDGDSTVALPAEVACCVSYKSSSISGIPASQCRGRIYIGPLSTRAVASEPATAKARPDLNMRTYLVSHFIALMGAVQDVGDCHLRQFSAKTGVLHAINEVWCDDAWDTQRRRGAEPSSRQTAIFV
jgi:hypothetical protein